MKSEIQYFITIKNKKYPYTLKVGKKLTIVKCEAANIDQDFLNEDIPLLLKDLPELIISEQKYQKGKDMVMRFRVSPEDKKIIEKKALAHGYSSVSTFLRALALGKS